MKTSEEFFEWAKDESGLHTPIKSFEQKHGRGIFRRFFYYIPCKGPGAVNRVNRKKFKSAVGSAKLHEFVDIGVPGTVQTRRAACHQCAACWRDDRRNCEQKEYVGMPAELRLQAESEPTTSLSRVTRAELDRQAIARAVEAAVGTCICIETAREEMQVPWLLGKVLYPAAPAPAATTQPSAGGAEAAPSQVSASAQAAVSLDMAKPGEMAVQVQLYEPIDAGSSIVTLSTEIALIPARRVRVIDILLLPVQRPAPPPQTAAFFRPRRGSGSESATSTSTALAQHPPSGSAATPAASGPPTRYKLAPEGEKGEDGSTSNGLLEIRAEMPTLDDTWEVEEVVQYRTYYRKEQWLVKWKGYGEDRNTWEPWENLLVDWVRERAEAVKHAALESGASRGGAARGVSMFDVLAV